MWEKVAGRGQSANFTQETSNSAAGRACETKPILTAQETVSGRGYTLTGIVGIISGYESSPEV